MPRPRWAVDGLENADRPFVPEHDAGSASWEQAHIRLAGDPSSRTCASFRRAALDQTARVARSAIPSSMRRIIGKSPTSMSNTVTGKKGPGS